MKINTMCSILWHIIKHRNKNHIIITNIRTEKDDVWLGRYTVSLNKQQCEQVFMYVAELIDDSLAQEYTLSEVKHILYKDKQ